MNKVFTKYQLMRVRMKISFHAFIKNETILEIWLKTMERSIRFLMGSGQISKNQGTPKTQMLQNLGKNLLLSFMNIVKV